MATTLDFPTTHVFLFLVIIIGLLSHQFHLTIAKPIKGFSLKLIHMHSPESPFYTGNNLSAHQKIQQLVDVSESRFFELQSRITKTVGVVDDPNIIRPPVTKRGNLYHVQIRVGTPPNPYYVALDTAGSLTWIQCLPNEYFFPQIGPPFNPDHSTTYGTLPCDHPFCQEWPCVGGRCRYDIDYKGGRVTKGTMSHETFAFQSNTGGGAMEQITNMIFGCSNNNQNFSNFQGDGILGMSLKRVSLIGQLSHTLGNKVRFSYCLVPPGIRSYTHLRFGADVKRQGLYFQSTPFVPMGTKYGLNLMGISVNNNQIHFEHDAFALRHDGTGGCIIDSGAAITFMDSIPYQTLRQAIMQHFAPYHHQLRFRTLEGFDLCYSFRGNFQNFPSLTFHFEDADLEVMPDNTFIINYHDHYFCFAVKPIVNGPTIIGAIQQQYYRMVYDISEGELRFALDDCSQH